ncbi:MAG: hypothetical protein JO112_22760, partial [Planctomycetes bacterium]|nr:hypothetical protein [Planctomycetota bacterium]
MKRWLCLCAGLGLTGLAWAAEPPAPAVATKPDHTPNPAETVPEAEQGEGLSLTIYNQDFVVVKERRKMDLTQGRSAVRFPDVAATIVPESVQFSTLGDPTLAR